MKWWGGGEGGLEVRGGKVQSERGEWEGRILILGILLSNIYGICNRKFMHITLFIYFTTIVMGGRQTNYIIQSLCQLEAQW